MKNIYLIKQNPDSKKSDIVWIEMNREEFQAFIHSDNAVGRYFARLRKSDDETQNIIYETDEKSYAKWRIEKRHFQYRKEGDYLLPNIQAPEAPKIGKYGMLRHTFLRRYRKTMLSGLQLNGKLNEHLEQIDRQANEMTETLMSEMAKLQGVNEELKSSNQMKWVQMMNNIRASAEETVLKDIVYS